MKAAIAKSTKKMEETLVVKSLMIEEARNIKSMTKSVETVDESMTTTVETLALMMKLTTTMKNIMEFHETMNIKMKVEKVRNIQEEKSVIVRKVIQERKEAVATMKPMILTEARVFTKQMNFKHI